MPHQPKTQLQNKGYAIVPNLYSQEEVNAMINCIENIHQEGHSFMKTRDVYAIRQLLKNVPELPELLFNDNLKALLKDLSEETYFLTKAIYFDKPRTSNWFVAYHQDLSISVDQKADLEHYSNWTFKKGQYGVQPPLKILQDTITLRIHLDDTDQHNGALKVIPQSHLQGIIRIDSNDKQRRVIHLEFNKHQLETPLEWMEYCEVG